MERQRELGLEDNEIIYLAGSLFGAGSDTVSFQYAFKRTWLTPDLDRRCYQCYDHGRRIVPRGPTSSPGAA